MKRFAGNKLPRKSPARSGYHRPATPPRGTVDTLPRQQCGRDGSTGGLTRTSGTLAPIFAARRRVLEGGQWSSSSRVSRRSCAPRCAHSWTRSARSGSCGRSWRPESRPTSSGGPWLRWIGRPWPCPRSTAASASPSWRWPCFAEELGRVVAPGPLLATVSQFVPVVREVGTPEQRRRFLAGVASGAITGTRRPGRPCPGLGSRRGDDDGRTRRGWLGAPRHEAGRAGQSGHQ